MLKCLKIVELNGISRWSGAIAFLEFSQSLFANKQELSNHGGSTEMKELGDSSLRHAGTEKALHAVVKVSLVLPKAGMVGGV